VYTDAGEGKNARALSRGTMHVMERGNAGGGIEGDECGRSASYWYDRHL
jgi:hypothetical protein